MSLKNNKGITLVEIIVSIAILGIIVTPLSSLFVSTVRNNAMARDKMIANQLAQKHMEYIMLKIKKGELIITDTMTEGKYTSKAVVASNDDYAVSTTNEKTDMGACDITIDASSILSDGDTIEINSNIIKLKDGVTLGSYLDSSVDIKIKLISIGDSDKSIDLFNESGKPVYIYKVYDKEDKGKIFIDTRAGEVYNYENIYDDSSLASENQNKNYYYKINIKVTKSGESNPLVEIASYKTND